GGEVTEADFGFFDSVGDDMDLLGSNDVNLMNMGNTGDHNQQIPKQPNEEPLMSNGSSSNMNLGFDSSMDLYGHDRLNILDEEMDLDLEDITTEMDMQAVNSMKDSRTDEHLVAIKEEKKNGNIPSSPGSPN